MNLTKENYKIIGAKLYRNAVMDDSVFNQDLMLIVRIISRIKKFASTGELRVKVLYNNYVIACNCFGNDYVNASLFLLADESISNTLFSILHTFGRIGKHVIINNQNTITFNDNNLIPALQARISAEIMR